MFYLLLMILFGILFEASPFLVLLGKIQLHTLGNRPLNADIRIIPCKPAFIIRMIEIRALIAEFRFITQNDEAMGKILVNEELLLILSGKENAEPLPVSLRSFSEIYRNIKDLAFDYANELILRIIDLKMQTAKNSLNGAGLIVLNELMVNSRSCKIIVVISLHEITALVAVNGRCNDLKSLYITCFNCNFAHFYSFLPLSASIIFLIFVGSPQTAGEASSLSGYFP